jgi:hypothetical protein
MDSHKLSRTQIKNVALQWQWGAWVLGAEAALSGYFQECRSTIPGGELWKSIKQRVWYTIREWTGLGAGVIAFFISVAAFAKV